jgi:hypothetical protein
MVHGLHLLDDVDRIYTNQSGKAKIVKLFKEHGYEQLPDGRKIVDIVEAL